MTSNFHQLPSKWHYLTYNAVKAEKYIFSDPGYSVFLCRKALEEWVRWMYQHDEDLELPIYEDTLSNLMLTQDFKDIIAPNFIKPLHILRKLGNDAAHTNKKITSDEALHVLQILHSFVYWVANLYHDGDEPILTPVFDKTLLIRTVKTGKSKAELQKLEQYFISQQNKLTKVETELAHYKTQKVLNLNEVDNPQDPNEAITRKLYIELLLNEAGWDLSTSNTTEFPLKNCILQVNGNMGDGFADYVLWGDDGLPLALVEAKLTTKDITAGRIQAERYAIALKSDFGQLPIIFYTNGFETYLLDDGNYAPRLVHGFYTKDELQSLVNRRTSKAVLLNQIINNDIANRHYQQEAIRAVSEALENKHRGALLVMATGTGKTRVAAAIVDLLSKANWVTRVLFLADRNALVEQAQINFNQFLPNMPAVDLTREKDNNSSRIVLSTYQTLINMIDGEGNGSFYGVGHFDLIIFDEIHRSVYNKYKTIFNYFDGYKLGLTATPKAEIDKDTYALFDLSQGKPTYTYELSTAVQDGFLVPPKAIGVPIKFQRKGIKYNDLKDEDKLKYEEQFIDPITGEFPEKIGAGALNSWLFNADTVDKVISHVMQHGIKIENGDKLAKTIIFARSHKHALFISERFNLQYPEYCGTFLRIIDYQESARAKLLNDFKNSSKQPQIAVSVDMLDTGIDIPEVCNLVFFKPVMSQIKYWQMVGRGTRLCKDLLAPGIDKNEFVIFDFCGNFEFFGQQPEGIKASNTKRLSQRLFEARVTLAKALQKTGVTENIEHAKKLKEITILQTQALNQNNFAVRQHWQIIEKYNHVGSWDVLSDINIHEIFEHIAPLVLELDQDQNAKIFDLKIMQLQLSLATGSNGQDSQINAIKMIATNLSKKTLIPTINKKIELLRDMQVEEFWRSISIQALENARLEIRELIKFLERESTQIVFSTYEDEYVGEATTHDILGSTKFDLSRLDLPLYKKKVELYLKQNENHLTIHKLRNNLTVTIDEIDGLEKILFKQGNLGSKEQFIQAYGKQSLGRSIRSILGLEVHAARIAFAKFLNNTTFNARQIQFINEIINSFVYQGFVSPAMLFQIPFTDICSGGVTELFGDQVAKQIIKLMYTVNSNA